MRIETTIQESRPKDQSCASKMRACHERENSKLVSVGDDAPLKHVRALIQKYGISKEAIFKATS